MTRYPRDQMAREVAFIAYYFHWPREQILELSHLERRSWVEEISRLNEEVNEAGEES